MYPKYSSTSNITFRKYIAHIVEIHSCRMFLSLRGARCTYTHFLMTYVCKCLPSEPPVAIIAVPSYGQSPPSILQYSSQRHAANTHCFRLQHIINNKNK